MNNELKNRIMRRVYGIWFIRRVAPSLVSMGALVFVGLRVMAQSFFVAKIAENFVNVAGASLAGIPQFIASALNSAEPSALIVIAFSGIVSFVLAVKLLRSIRALVSNRGYFSSNFKYSQIDSE
jgi:hypothetical protein